MSSCIRLDLLYASNRARLCTLHEVEEIYERAVQAIPYSVNLWGNTDVAYLIYEKAIELAKEKGNLNIIPNLYTNFARFTFVVSLLGILCHGCISP
ncbi:hypothetical protein BHE74_00020105 [Ensete ventricosum]|nr:hypothetical protein BHE74_00020105 [Ensete ventricosum]